MRTRLLLVGAATLILLLALLNVVAEQLHWRRGTFGRQLRADIEQRGDAARSTATSRAPAPPPKPLRTAEGE